MNNRLDWILRLQLIRGMKENITHLGEKEAWRIINTTLEGEIRLTYIEIYLQTKYQYNENEDYLGDNFPHWKGE